MRPFKSDFSRLVLPLLTSLLFSGSYVSAKFATDELTPVSATFWRYLCALLLLSILVIRRPLRSLEIELRHTPRLLALGLFGIVGYHYFFFLSIERTLVANTAIINALSPVVTGTFAAIFLHEKLQPRQYCGIILGIAGVVILILSGPDIAIRAQAVTLGDALMLLAVLSWAVYSLVAPSLLRIYDGLTLTFYATLFGVILLSFLLPFESPLRNPLALSQSTILAVIYMGVFASGLGYLTFTLSIKNIGPTLTTGLVYSLVPALVAILAFLFFRQKITAGMVIGATLILPGLVLMLRKRRL